MVAETQVLGGDRVMASEYRALRDAVGWLAVDSGDEELQGALDRTWNVTARRPDGELVGLVRLLDDGLLYAGIWDMIVAPDLQRRGIGRALFDRALERTGDGGPGRNPGRRRDVPGGGVLRGEPGQRRALPSAGLMVKARRVRPACPDRSA